MPQELEDVALTAAFGFAVDAQIGISPVHHLEHVIVEDSGMLVNTSFVHNELGTTVSREKLSTKAYLGLDEPIGNFGDSPILELPFQE